MHALFLLVCLFTMNIGHPMIELGAVFAPRVGGRGAQSPIAGRRAKVGDMLVDDVERLVQDMILIRV